MEHNEKEAYHGDGHDNGKADVESPHPEPNEEEFNLAAKHEQLERGLKSRHIQFLALGECLFFLFLFSSFLPMRIFSSLGRRAIGSYCYLRELEATM